MTKPDPDYSMTIAASHRRVRIILAGTVIADSGAALVLREASFGPVYYLPRADARWEHFTRSARRSHCPYKGEASYYTLTVGDTIRADAVWSYEAPIPSAAEIKDHLAFYPDRVDAIELL